MKRLLTENPGWKLFSLVVATILWYALVGETEFATSLPVSVQFRNVPQDLELSLEPLDRVFVRLRGPATRLNASALREVGVVFDLAQVQSPGDRTFSLTRENLQLPPGVEVSRVVPSQVRLTFERRITRDVPVEVRFSGPPPRGYRITGQQARPDNVRVVGPEARVQSIQSVHTDPIDLSSTFGNAEFRVPAFVADPQVRFAAEPPPTISVRIFMEKIPQ